MGSISDFRLIRPVLEGDLQKTLDEVEGSEKHFLEIIFGALQLGESVQETQAS